MALLALLAFAAGPAWAAGGSNAAPAGREEDKSAVERLRDLCMVDPKSTEAYCDCGTRVAAEYLPPRDLEVMAFAMDRTVWGGSKDVMEDAKAEFALSESEIVTIWRNIAKAGLKSSETCRTLR